MMRLIVMLLVLAVLAGCRGRWVEEIPCPGGRVDIERRTTSVVAGQTRNTITRTNSCLE